MKMPIFLLTLIKYMILIFTAVNLFLRNISTKVVIENFILLLKVVVYQIVCCQVEGRGASNFRYSILLNIDCH